MIALDTETTWTKDRGIGTHGVHAYVRHPETECFMVSIYDADTNLSFVGHPKDAPWERLRGQDICCHNYSFDSAVLRELERRKVIPFPLAEKGFCTANLAAYLQVPRSLLGSSAELLGIGLDKTTRDKFKGKDFRTLPEEVKIEIANYALQDAKACWLLWKKFGHLMPDFERRLSAHTTLMGDRGIALDVEGVEVGIRHYKEVLWGLEKLIPWAKTAPIMSLPQMRAACIKAGIPAPESTAKNDEKFQVWADQYAAKVPFVAALAKYRSVNRALSVLEAMRVRYVDDRLRYGLKYYGAVPTGRWAGDSGLNCVTGDHEVLTRDGWVRIDQWNPDTHEIVQWNPDETLEFVAAKKVSKPFTGQLVSVESNSISLLATPDHRVICKRWDGEVEVGSAAEFLRRRVRVPTGGLWRGESTGLTHNQIRLMVALAADGHVTKKGKAGVSFGFRRERKILRLRALLSAEGIPFREKVYESKGKRTTAFYIFVGDLPAWWKKGLGPWILNLDLEGLNVLMDELVHWDGYLNVRSGTLHLCAVAPGDPFWVATAAHLCGKTASVNECARANGSSRWLAYVRKSSAWKWVSSGVGTATAREVEVTETPVYCPQVPSSFWLVRRNGKIHVTGNCQNFTRDAVEGVDIRRMLVAGPGKKFISADLSQIEPRVSLYVTGDTKQLALIRQGMCIYEAHARQTLGYALPTTMKEAAKTDESVNKLRQFAKARILGLTYYQQGKGFQVYAKNFGIDLTLDEAYAQVKQFHQANPKLVAFWNQLEQGLRMSRGSTFELELPSGRFMRYFDVAVTRNERGYPDYRARPVRGEPATYYTKGKSHNNVCQGTARDVFGEKILAIEYELGLPVVLTVHDEVLVEVDAADADDARVEVSRIMARPPEWMPDLPLASDCFVSDRYEK